MSERIFLEGNLNGIRGHATAKQLTGFLSGVEHNKKGEGRYLGRDQPRIENLLADMYDRIYKRKRPNKKRRRGRRSLNFYSKEEI